MAVRMHDELSEILGNSEQDARVENWLRLFLALKQVAIPGAFDSAPRSDVARFINSKPELRETVRIARSQALVPESRLSWLTDGVRQNKWLLRNLSVSIGFGSADVIGASSFLLGRERIVAIFDAYYPYGQAKEDYIGNAKWIWERQLHRDKVLDWFRDVGDDAAREKMWTWLNSQRPSLCMSRWVTPTQEDLLNFLDEYPPRESEIKLVISEIKKDWSQRKYRASLKGKRQCNLILKETTISQLDKLAKTYDLSRSELLELLVSAEARQKVYINQKLQKRHDLMH